MRKNKKVLFITLLAVLVIGATLGTVAVAQANSRSADTGIAAVKSWGVSSNLSLYQKISDIYQANTGTTIDPTQLQTAFEQAHQQLATEARDARLQELVTAGKITQEQADAYKTWLNAKPSTAITDEYKQWSESRPQDVPGLSPRGFGGAGMPRTFGGGMMGHMFRR